MFVIGSNSASTGYNLTRSLRTRASASGYLNRTPASTTNQKTFTYSFWIKRGILSTAYKPISAGTSGSEFGIQFMSSNGIEFYNYTGAYNFVLNTTQVFRDPSAWYHIVAAVDTTQATASNRVLLYVNGLQVTSFTTATYPSLNFNTFVNTSGTGMFVGALPSSQFFDGYFAEVNFIDGQALTPSSFGSTNALTGVWQPAAYTGSYGTNGFYLPFTDNSALTTSSNVGLGKDFSGNGNYWATNNISITAGINYDSMTDVPTLTSATAANYCVMNPLRNSNTTVTAANLNVASPSTTCGSTGTFAVDTGKWYWEVNCISNGTTTANGVPHIGLIPSDASDLLGGASNMVLYRSNGDIYNGVTYSQTGLATYTNNDVIGVAYDAGANSIQFYKNNTAVGTAVSTTAGKLYQPYWLVSYVSVNSSAAYNFGQRPFTYTPPTGYVALNTYNLPTSTIVKGNTVMDATLWTGNSTGSTTQTITNAGAFKPDFLWGKSRSTAYNHVLIDSIRGVTKLVYSDLTSAEVTNATALSSFNSNGFTVGIDAGGLNDSGKTFVGWQWQAGQGTNTSNTSGSITSTVSVNASAGFSVVTYTAQASGTGTVGHGLGVAPSLVITKPRANAYGWTSYHSSLGNTQYIVLNTTAAAVTDSTVWNNTSPTSSVFTSGSAFAGNGTYVAYCWTPIAGFSAFGSYTGNGSADGPFVYTGFRPRWIMAKQSSAAGQSWNIFDTARNTYNVTNTTLYANQSSAEDSVSNAYDILSNGFKLRTTASQGNTNSATYIYMAFAESPFKNSLAR